jgi:protein SCO1/2
MDIKKYLLQQRRAGVARRRPPKPLPMTIAVLVGGAVLVLWATIRTVTGTDPDLSPPAGVSINTAFTGLTDATGSFLDERALRSRYRLVTFGFTSCQNVCPLTLLGIHQALVQLGPDANRILPVFVSVDPKHDTRKALLAFVTAFDARITALTGPPAAIERVAQHYGVFVNETGSVGGPATGSVDHSAVVFLIDPQQRVRATITSTVPPAEIAASIVSAFRASIAP